MGRPKGSKKDIFADLDNDFKDAVAAESPEEIRKRIAQVALNEEENRKMKEEDQDLAQAVEAAKIAGEQYREATKMNRLRIKFCSRVLDDKEGK